MRTITLPVYTLAELKEESPTGYERALDKLREGATEIEWYDFVLDLWKERLEEEGFQDAEILFTGFWSQGDGASFTASLDLPKYMKHHKLAGKLRALYNAADGWNRDFEVEGSIRRRRDIGNYVHEYSIYASVELLGTTYGTREEQRLYKQMNVLELHLTERARVLSREIYRALEKELEYCTSDEKLHVDAEANEWEFFEDGRFAS